jgi:catecholate siderophore receptor
MSRQQRRAADRRLKKLRHRISLAAGEGVGRAVAFTFALAAAPSFAADDEGKNEEFSLPPVVVREQSNPYNVPQTSLPKIPEPLKDVPQSITIIPEKILEERAATSFRDALRNVPGIGIQAGEGGGAQGDNLTLRGFNARNDIFLDGGRDQGTYFRDVFNLDSVEVLKGPSSMYFGRGSTGGIINQVSKTPRLDPSYGGVLSGGTPTFLRGTLDVNQPISPTSAFRFNAMVNKDDIAGRDIVDNKRMGFAPSIAFGIGTPTQITLSYLFQKEDNIPDYGFPYFKGRPLRTDRTHFYGLAEDDIEKTWLHIGTLRVEHSFNDQWNVRNTTRYSWDRRIAVPTRPTTTDGITITRTRSLRDLTESILGNQTDLTGKFETFGLKHTFVTGFDVTREVVDRTNYNFAGVPTTNSHNPDPFPDTSGMTRMVASRPYTTTIGSGIYATDQIKLNRYLDIVGGARWDYFKANFHDNVANPDLQFDRTDKKWSYRGGLVFHPVPWQSYYFSYATAFNPSAEGLALAANTTATPPEKNRTFEIGSKIDLMDGALNFTAAVFQIDKTNARTADPDDPTGAMVLEGQQRVRGVELGLTGRIMEGWNVFTGYSFLHSEILKSNDLQGGVPIEGKELQNVPHHSATLWTTYDFLEKWQIGGGLTYVGGRFANNSNTIRVPGYIRWDATAAYRLTKSIELRVNALNLTNQLYFDAIQNGRAIPAPGRSFVFSTNFKFGGEGK